MDGIILEHVDLQDRAGNVIDSANLSSGREAVSYHVVKIDEWTGLKRKLYGSEKLGCSGYALVDGDDIDASDLESITEDNTTDTTLGADVKNG